MGRQWFYQVMGSEVGPISADELKSLADRGVLDLDTPVRPTGGEWISASSVKGLLRLPQPKSSTIASVEPSVDDMPTHCEEPAQLQSVIVINSRPRGGFLWLVFCISGASCMVACFAIWRHEVVRQHSAAAEKAIAAIERLESRLEVGMTYHDYTNVVGETSGEVRIRLREADCPRDLDDALGCAMDAYKLAAEIWGWRIAAISDDNSTKNDADDLQHE